MKTGRRQDAWWRPLAVYLKRTRRQGRPCRHPSNDYLARRDSEWMGQIYNFLGLTVGGDRSRARRRRTQGSLFARHHLRHQQRYGFDYLRDNMKYPSGGYGSSAGTSTPIVDEVDSILIDEARTPLIISGPLDDPLGVLQHHRYLPSEAGKGRRLRGRREAAHG